ncbi:Ig-like domain-containing protein [Clostridium intestinale]|uniref:Ig-like domain-containing protein n=1 Tax=Clostridium intestinale TaxID=36845 RepID=UPI002DD63796|nr:Ig-like domain-containing protein [Clostridium intestinale]WRY53134.1 Ig-like domain-containing protein [Clostridium intestinale]
MMKIKSKKKFITFSLVVILTTIFSLIWVQGSNAFATTVGQQLFNPEAGWQRFDDTDSKIKYIETNDGRIKDTSHDYNGTRHLSLQGDKIIIKFYGTKFRIIATRWNNSGKNNLISIDGVESGTFSNFTDNLTVSTTRRVLVYEKTDLELGVHTIEMTATEEMMFDAIDVNSEGYLVDASTVAANEISLNKTSLSLNVGQVEGLIATLKPDNADNKSVTWSSSDESIATVDENGKVTAIKEGSVTITAKTADGTNLTATCAVNVITNNESVTVESEKDKLALNSEFTTDIVLHNVKNIYAEDFTVAYDKDLFEYVGYEDIEGLKVFKEIKDTDNGKLRFIVASLGEENGINEDKAVVKLKFKTKASGKGKIDVLKTRISDNEALEKDILEENCGEKEFEIFADVNRTGDFTLIDLGIDAYYYGKNVADTDKTKYDADVISNGVIDDADLAEIAEQMIKNDKYEPNN